MGFFENLTFPCFDSWRSCSLIIRGSAQMAPDYVFIFGLLELSDTTRSCGPILWVNSLSMINSSRGGGGGKASGISSSKRSWMSTRDFFIKSMTKRQSNNQDAHFNRGENTESALVGAHHRLLHAANLFSLEVSMGWIQSLLAMVG